MYRLYWVYRLYRLYRLYWLYWLYGSNSFNAGPQCRGNWQVYVTEFAEGVEALIGRPACVSRFAPDAALTPFERKYRASGHVFWRAAVLLP